jgi:YD repeat-containing protein
MEPDHGLSTTALVGSGSHTYDANGNTLSDPSGKSYTWDFENRLVQAVVPGTNGGTTTFKYDPFGRRIYKQSPSFTSAFLYDGADLAGGPPSRLSVYAIPTGGAPSLRSLQGWAAMLHALFDWLPRDMDQQSCAGIPDSHPSQKDAKDRAPTLLLMPAKNQKPGQSACDQPACASIPVSRPSQRARRTGHPLYC